MRVFLALLLVALPASTTPAPAKQSDFTIRYGVMAPFTDDEFHVIKETTQIPYITKTDNPTFMFGYTVHSNKPGFRLYSLCDFPAPKNYSINVEHSKETTNGRLVIKTSERNYDRYHYGTFRLEDGDPPGLYRVEIYVNGQLESTIEFTVGDKQ